MRILVVIGTRPEAIKLAPLVQELAGIPGVAVKICLTGQHRELLEQGLADFGIEAHHNLDIMSDNQSINQVSARLLAGMGEVFAAERPDWVVVQGDTTTAMATALAGFQHRLPVAHVEAGLRTGDLSRPWPEEMNRRLIGQLASIHFAPTEGARANLIAEGVPGHAVHVCGNTVIDALVMACRRLDAAPKADYSASGLLARLDERRPMLLVTLHRRENLNPESLKNVEAALIRIVDELGCPVVLPYHLNPAMGDTIARLRDHHPDLVLVSPMSYLPFVALMRRATAILTDSGGIQEEAAYLGKPVLIMRERTERPEVLSDGFGSLVGTDPDAIVEAARHALALRGGDGRGSASFGDGTAARRIAFHLLNGIRGRP
ncbi:MAG: UDP-N-acetylglucosamine 2-epimerase (non-hydrolyzing) [Alphaproteobacteria bacterium]|nr:UDP-N-acetylglucosamine 2-epimerase (non-hydrolyzing) [Alphaproteobacteria bacterium]